MLKVPCFVLRMQFAYLENYLSASDCQAKRLGMGMVQRGQKALLSFGFESESC